MHKILLILVHSAPVPAVSRRVIVSPHPGLTTPDVPAGAVSSLCATERSLTGNAVALFGKDCVLERSDYEVYSGPSSRPDVTIRVTAWIGDRPFTWGLLNDLFVQILQNLPLPDKVSNSRVANSGPTSFWDIVWRETR